jgi:hypothetical protein
LAVRGAPQATRANEVFEDNLAGFGADSEQAGSLFYPEGQTRHLRIRTQDHRVQVLTVWLTPREAAVAAATIRRSEM